MILRQNGKHYPINEHSFQDYAKNISNFTMVTCGLGLVSILAYNNALISISLSNSSVVTSVTRSS